MYSDTQLRFSGYFVYMVGMLVAVAFKYTYINVLIIAIAIILWELGLFFGKKVYCKVKGY